MRKLVAIIVVAATLAGCAASGTPHTFDSNSSKWSMNRTGGKKI
jgi:hypothetical protein